MSSVLFVISTAAAAHAQQPVVRAVLFWAAGCGHCETVKTQTLAPLQFKYGQQLDIQMLEVSSKENYDYFRQLEDRYAVPAQLRGVPALVIGDRLLVGDQQIPAELPGLIERHLAAGGRGLPALPGLAERLIATGAGGVCAPETPCPEPASAASAPALAALKFSASGLAAAGPSAVTAVELTSRGFELAWAVMALLAAALLYALAATVLSALGRSVPAGPAWGRNVIPLLAVIGLGVALYLTYVETQNVKAVCGPVGDCNSVQASPYARLFGVLPVGLLGAFGYVAMLAAWAVWRFTGGALARWALMGLLGMALFGVLFSIYLTYLELYIILAVCIWCVTSAAVQALLLILAVGPALEATDQDE
jgi:uncharacterized membrane protein/thiol-disulfide isomerase/thioredoxin